LRTGKINKLSFQLIGCVPVVLNSSVEKRPGLFSFSISSLSKNLHNASTGAVHSLLIYLSLALWHKVVFRTQNVTFKELSIDEQWIFKLNNNICISFQRRSTLCLCKG
jgi:hypothetical protein